MIVRSLIARKPGFVPAAVAAISLLAVPGAFGVASGTTASPGQLVRPDAQWRMPAGEPEFARFADWTEQFLGTIAPGGKAAAEVDGVVLARNRRRAMAELIRHNPQRALELAVPIRVRKALPSHIAAELEEHVGGRGDRSLFAALAEPGKETEVAPNFWKATIKGRTFDAFVYGRRLDQPTRKNIPLHGVALDGEVAIDENPARVLDAAEAEAIKQSISEPICGTSGLVTTTFADETALDVGGDVYFFCQFSHAESFNRELTAQEEGTPVGDSGGGDVEASAWTEGMKKLILIRVDFPNLAGPPLSDASAISLIQNLHNFYSEMSYGRAGFYTNGAGSEFTPTFRMSQPAAYYGTNNYYNQLRTEARNAATAAGYVLTNYNLDVICMGSVPGFSWSGLAYVGAAGAWLRNSFGTGVAGHELGHNFGLNHANFWDTSSQSTIGPGTSVEYGDSFDTMGSASAGNNHFNARYKNYLTWLRSNEVTKVTASGTYRVYAHDQTNVAAGVRGLSITKNTATNYWVEFRQKFTSNKWLMSGAGLRWGGTGNQKSHLLDTTPGSTDAKNDAALVMGRTFSDKPAGVHITPIRKGGTTPESLDVVVNLGTFPGNVAPIVAIAASATNAATGVTLTFSATASDANGDALAYYWDFGDGNFGTNGPAAAKSWSAAGEYVVRCTVSDMKGGQGSDSLVVRIGSPTTFRISGRAFGDPGLIEGVRVYVSTTRMTYTDSDGTYNIVGLPAGSYTVNASLYGYSFTNANFANPVYAGANVANINFISGTNAYNLPTIATQPQSQTVFLGGSPTFGVAASGKSPLSYQWRFNGAGIAGAGGSSYTKTNVQATDAGNYSVVVSNLFGTVTSVNAVLTVDASSGPLAIQSLTHADGVITLSWRARAGTVYRLQFTDDLAATEWQDVGPDVTATGPTASATDTPPGAHRFYRILVVE